MDPPLPLSREQQKLAGTESPQELDPEPRLQQSDMLFTETQRDHTSARRKTKEEEEENQA